MRLTGQLAGKYKGVPFSVRKETLLGVGRKRVEHLYPKSSSRYLEDMGNEPFSESIDLFFHGENFREDFSRFQQAIKDPSPGRLFSPTFGVFNSIIAIPSSFDSDQKTIGEITATVIFKETIEKPSPILSAVSEQDVAQLANEARADLLISFQNSYESPSTLSNLATIKSDALDLVDIIKTITRKSREANLFIRKLNSALLDPAGFALLLLSQTAPFGILQQLSLTYRANEGFPIFKSLATTGNILTNSINDILDGVIPIEPIFSKNSPLAFALNTTIPLWSYNTEERSNRNKRRIGLVNTFRIAGLIGMMESMTAKVYATTEEIIKDQSELEIYYEEIVENSENSPIMLSLKNNLDIIKNSTTAVLLKKSQQAFVITEVEVLRYTSSFLLAYELYGEYLQNNEQHLYMSNIIANLNRSQVRYRLIGTVRVVEIGV